MKILVSQKERFPHLSILRDWSAIGNLKTEPSASAIQRGRVLPLPKLQHSR
jgi:hypothetical protein